ncbi:MAG: biotin--[acetyl-CoA-carboxylase] ligase [Calditrichaeota bacterium]|nr:biotin--[acetyl-CoA-carboxylase] ligase [Calditrichota bacterium]
MREAVLRGDCSPLTVYVARHQRAGRGRLGRKWATPPGQGLLFSLLHSTKLPVERHPSFGIIAASGVAEGLENVLEEFSLGLTLSRNADGLPDSDRTQIGIKWPNDLMVGGRKLAGLLCESLTAPGGERLIIIGVGINVQQHASEFPVDFRRPATSLRMITGVLLDPVALLRYILPTLVEALDEQESSQGMMTCRVFAERGITPLHPVDMQKGDVLLRGILERVDDLGAAHLRLPDGREQVIHSGELDAYE